ncbi:MAG: polyamine aminopropyltransferase, partial [Bacteroidota bacterium]
MTVKPIFSEKGITILAVFIAGLCSIIYELLISTTASYFLGDSIKQFSIIIGVYMAAMGVGSYFSKFFPERLILSFVLVELLLGIIGGISVPLLYYCFEQVDRITYQFLTIALTALIGFFTGLEIPLLARIMKQYYPLKVNLANVLSLDYMGALLATLLFPFLLLPFFGTFRTGVFFGGVNVFLGLFVLWYFSAHTQKNARRILNASAVSVILCFLLLLYFTQPLLARWDDAAFSHKVIFSKQTPYQHLILTKNRADVRLYINRVIQFSSLDEYRYHESLALLPLNVSTHPYQVLILGGGEGLLAREVLKDPRVEQVTVVDLDAEVFRLARENPYVKIINEGAAIHPKVRLVPQDALSFLMDAGQYYDVILADLHDPSNDAVARLYSKHFYRLVQSRLSANGVFATQATSTFHTKNAFWCIEETIQQSGFEHVYPFHTYVPSFGDWGFVMASKQLIEPSAYQLDVPTQYLDTSTVKKHFHFEEDIQKP